MPRQGVGGTSRWTWPARVALSCPCPRLRCGPTGAISLRWEPGLSLVLFPSPGVCSTIDPRVLNTQMGHLCTRLRVTEQDSSEASQIPDPSLAGGGWGWWGGAGLWGRPDTTSVSVCPGTGSRTILCLGFLACEMGTLIAPMSEDGEKTTYMRPFERCLARSTRSASAPFHSLFSILRTWSGQHRHFIQPSLKERDLVHFFPCEGQETKA